MKDVSNSRQSPTQLPQWLTTAYVDVLHIIKDIFHTSLGVKPKEKRNKDVYFLEER